MNTKPKKFTLDIFDSQYSIISDENDDNLLKAAQLVDSLMREIFDQSKITDAKKVAVLAALRIANNLINVEITLEKYNEEQQKLASLIEEKEFNPYSKS